ncbi:olfactory receptor 52K1-like [Clarias gariepinus]|uniref:olfactory receptor 52K1-like n=1 Tax=Clarias gariepinus TaxID=13013 RepID=UPI00234C9956|nr:olfactory receptor 52K1-like [Clarias gariepinus]
MMLDTVQNISFTTFRLTGFHDLGEWGPILSIPYLLMFIFSSMLNVTLIYLIVSQQALHSPMCILIGLMAVMDFSFPFLFVPNMLLSFLFNWNAISLVGCLVQMFFIYFFASFHSTILLWMALDRFFAICKPLYYQKYMTMTNFQKFIIFPVIRNVVLVTVIVSWAGKLTFCATNEIDHCFCEHMALVQLACGDITVNNILGLLGIFLSMVSDFIFVIISYIVILSSVLRAGKTCLKAFNTCITHIIVMTVGMTFALIAFMSYRIRNNFSSSSRVFLSTMYLIFPSCFNPIIYGVRTKEIREQFLKLITYFKVFQK